MRLKNRELRNQDRYLFVLSEAFMDSQTLIDNYILEFVQENNIIKLSGSYTLKEGAGAQIIFYNPIVENYFNIKTEFSDTMGIISSNGKKIKYTIAKAAKNDIDVYLLFLQYEDDSLINAGDTITFNLTPDKNSILNKVLKQVENVQELGESLALRYMISPYYIQYPDAEGNFNNNEEPSNWFKKMYAVTTTWQIMFNDKSVFFRTEGTKSSVGRVNGLQPYGIKNISGGVVCQDHPIISSTTGICSSDYSYPQRGLQRVNSQKTYYQGFNFRTDRQIKSYSDDLVVDNYQIRIYKLLTINGKKISDVIGV